MFLGVVGISHKTAPVEVREKLTFEGETLDSLLNDLSAIDGIAECCVLATCNRTEFYLSPVRENNWNESDLVEKLQSLPLLQMEAFLPYLYTKVDSEAVEHILSVSAGMDSMVVGETQIACQVKDAYTAACKSQCNGILLNRLFHQAMETGKKVRSKTRISEGSLSVSHLACDLAKKIFSRLEDKTALLIGAGETAELTAHHLQERGIGRILIANRTYEKARGLAEKFHGEAIPFESLDERLAEADVVVSSTAAKQPVLDFQIVRNSMKVKQGKPIFVIDLGVPRDVDPSVDKLADVFRYDMDDLQKMVENNRRVRMEEVEMARRIVKADRMQFVAWTKERMATPTIMELQKQFDNIRVHELRHLNGKLDEKQMEMVEMATRAMMNKILCHPIMHLKDATKKQESSKLINTIRDILGLHEE